MYNLFFGVKNTAQEKEKETDSQKDGETIDHDKDERMKKLALKLEQQLNDFEDRGGFKRVLKDIFNPTDQSSMELDSVYQLKLLCKAFFQIRGFSHLR